MRAGVDLEALRRKYERMLSLREAHDRARRDPTFEEPDPRAELASLADEFPGALREIDRLPLETIRARIVALGHAAAHADAALPPWIRAQAEFHRHARGALAVKRWLDGRRAIDASTRQAFDDALASLVLSSPEAALFADDLAEIAAPPRGRIMDVVFARVALLLEISVEEVRRLVLGAEPRATRLEDD